jgi:hypothetical protein
VAVARLPARERPGARRLRCVFRRDFFTNARLDAARPRRGPAMPNEIDPGEVILEFVQIGALVRVSAMEPA